MATVQIFGSGTISIGTTASPTDQFECQISAFTLTPTAQSVQVPATYCAGATTAATPSSWAVAFDHAQDWGADPSLSELLLENDGELLHFSFVADDPTVGAFTGQCYGVAPTIGGPGQGLWVSTGTMPMPAPPTYTGV